jgi:hypothetical protein
MKLHGLSPARDWLTLLTVDINITKFYAVTATELRHSSVILLSIRKNLCSRPRLSFIVIMTDIQNFCERKICHSQ